MISFISEDCEMTASESKADLEWPLLAPSGRSHNEPLTRLSARTALTLAPSRRTAVRVATRGTTFRRWRRSRDDGRREVVQNPTARAGGAGDSAIVKVHPDGTVAFKKRTASHRQIPRRKA
jgi:hypothetical protein